MRRAEGRSTTSGHLDPFFFFFPLLVSEVSHGPNTTTDKQLQNPDTILNSQSPLCESLRGLIQQQVSSSCRLLLLRVDGMFLRIDAALPSVDNITMRLDKEWLAREGGM